ncbi:MAG: hypothetical protein HQK84_05790 [Nitrospinae bacterium]|nr:hypothetical protein [Nitrospinota bacterium]
MKLSNAGRIVVIDDKYQDVKNLLKVLNKEFIPFIYSTGMEDTLPSKPPGGIRLVFLDLILKGGDGQSDKNKVSTLMGVLTKFIDSKNGPYVIVFWSKHKELIDSIIEKSKELDIAPVMSLDMEKSECLNSQNPLDFIASKLEECLKKLQGFQVLTEWENAVNEASKKYVNEFFEIVKGDDWSDKLSKTFYSLYQGIVGQSEINNEDDKFQLARQVFNNGFQDILENISKIELKKPEDFNLKEGIQEEEIAAKTNDFLSLVKEPSEDEIRPGYVLLEENHNLNENLIKNVFSQGKDFKLGETPLVCKIIITPECDIAQNKKLLHRLVYAIITEQPLKMGNLGDSWFVIGPLFHDNKIKYITCCHQTVTSHNEIEGRTLFALKRDLLFDLQSKVANHVNRLGNITIMPYKPSKK